MILYIILGAVLGAFALIGFITGLIRGYAKIQSWGGQYAISAMATIAISSALSNSGMNSMAVGIIAIACAVGLLLVCMVLSGIIKSSIKRSFKKRAANLRKKGFTGVVDRLFGAVALAIKACVMFMIIAVPVLIVLDFAQLSSLEILASVYDSAFWLALKPVAFDLILIGVINLAIRHGFARGIATSLWSILVFALVIGAGFLAYNLVFNTQTFSSAIVALSEKVGGWFNDIEALANLTEVITKWILTAGLFLLLLIVVIVVSFFMSRVISFARFGSGFYVIDGIIGTIVALIIALAVMLFLGYLISPLYGLDFMQPFDAYFESSAFAKYFYQNNILIEMGMKVLLPLNEWLS